MALRQNKAGREEFYRAMFRAALDDDPIKDLRMIGNQAQPIANARFYAEIEAMNGQRRKVRRRGPRRRTEAPEAVREFEQHELPL